MKQEAKRKQEINTIQRYKVRSWVVTIVRRTNRQHFCSLVITAKSSPSAMQEVYKFVDKLFYEVETIRPLYEHEVVFDPRILTKSKIYSKDTDIYISSFRPSKK